MKGQILRVFIEIGNSFNLIKYYPHPEFIFDTYKFIYYFFKCATGFKSIKLTISLTKRSTLSDCERVRTEEAKNALTCSTRPFVFAPASQAFRQSQLRLNVFSAKLTCHAKEYY